MNLRVSSYIAAVFVHGGQKDKKSSEKSKEQEEKGNKATQSHKSANQLKFK
jgi:hypothetical protein